MLDLAPLDRILDGSRRIFNGHRWVNPVVIAEVKGIKAKALQGALGTLLDVLKAASAFLTSSSFVSSPAYPESG